MSKTQSENFFLDSYLRQDIPLHNYSVTIVIPCLNEEGNLERLLLNIEETFEKIGFSLPVLVVDDGSTDDSYKILNQMSEKCDYLSIIRHSERRGVTGVWKTALDNV